MAVSYQDYLRGTPGASRPLNQNSLGDMGYIGGGNSRYRALPGAAPLDTQQRIQANMLHQGGKSSATDRIAPAQLVGPGFGRPPATNPGLPQQQTDPYQQWMQQQLAIMQNPIAAGVAGRVGHSDGTPPSLGMGAVGGVGGLPGMFPPPLPTQAQPGVPMNQQLRFYQQSVDQNKRFDAAEQQRIAREREERKRLNSQVLATGPYFPKRPASNPFLPQMGFGG